VRFFTCFGIGPVKGEKGRGADEGSESKSLYRQGSEALEKNQQFNDKMAIKL